MYNKQALYKTTRIVTVLFSLFVLMTASAALAASVTFRWDQTVSPHDGYRVFARKAGQAYNYSQPNWQGAATTCTINNLQNQTEYYFVARAYNGSLQSANSNEVHYVPGGTATGGTTTGGTTTSGSTTGQQPYGGKTWPVPGTIEAEDYDTGGEAAAYHDTSAGNQGGKYRTDNVDIWNSSSIGLYTGANSTGEWLEYTVNVATSGTYSLDLNVATPNSGRKMRVRLDGKDVSGAISVPNTGGWNNWETVMTTVQLSAGKHVLRVEFVLGGLNFNWIDISPIGATKSGTTTGSTTTGGTTTGQKPYGGTPWRLPGTIEAEDYDTGGEGSAYHDTTAANEGGQYRTDGVDIWKSYKDYYTGSNNTGEWLEYTVNVAYAGSYKLDLRVATPNSGGKLRVKLDGVYVTGPISVPNTGAWNVWRTVRATANLKAGKHVLRVEFIQGGFNLNWIDVF